MAGTPGKEMHHGQHAGRERGLSCPHSRSPPGYQCHFASPVTQIPHRAQPNLCRQAAGSLPPCPLLAVPAAGAIWQRSLDRYEALAGHSSRLQQDITHTFPARHFPLNY